MDVCSHCIGAISFVVHFDKSQLSDLGFVPNLGCSVQSMPPHPGTPPLQCSAASTPTSKPDVGVAPGTPSLQLAAFKGIVPGTPSSMESRSESSTPLGGEPGAVVAWLSNCMTCVLCEEECPTSQAPKWGHQVCCIKCKNNYNGRLEREKRNSALQAWFKARTAQEKKEWYQRNKSDSTARQGVKGVTRELEFDGISRRRQNKKRL